MNVPAWAQERYGEPLRSVSTLWATVSPPDSVSPIPPLLRVSEAASFLQVSSKTVRRLLTRGDLKAVRIGRLLRIHSSEIDRLIADGGSRDGGFEGGEGYV